MAKFFMASSGPDDWRGYLASPSNQWRTGFSAKTLAYCWEAAGGFPASVTRVFAASAYPALRNLEFIFGLPEFQTPLVGGRGPSQSDIFVVACTGQELVSITVEGKVEGTFGSSIVGDWLKDASSGKRERLADPRKHLGLSNKKVDHIWYQLLHRTASALIEAERIHAKTAIMLVHSFSQNHSRFEDYQDFVALFGKTAELDSVTSIGKKKGIALYTAWVVGESEFLAA